MTAFAPGFPLGSKESPDAVKLEIVIGPVLRVGDEEFAAAVLPDLSVVLCGLCTEIPAIHIEENADSFPAPSQ